jgi:hypothetical protein
MKPELSEDRWDHIGIPGQSRIESLLYNRTAESLVAVASRRLDDGLEVRRFYYRRLPWELYSPVGVGHPMESQNGAVCSWDTPFLFFNVWRFLVLLSLIYGGCRALLSSDWFRRGGNSPVAVCQ